VAKEPEPRLTDRFEQVASTTLWRGGFLRVEELSIRGPSGRVFTRHVVRHPGAVGVVALDGSEAILVVAYRPAVGTALLEIPAGKLDVGGETPLDCAQRELAEEVGLRADSWTPLVTFHTTPGFTDEIFHLFSARGLRAVERDPKGEEEMEMEQVRVPLEDVPAMIADGRLRDAKTILGLLLTRQASR
jgi:ADP-ribose diphosphatase